MAAGLLVSDIVNYIVEATSDMYDLGLVVGLVIGVGSIDCIGGFYLPVESLTVEVHSFG